MDALTGGLPVLAQVPVVGTWRDRSSTQLVSLDAPHSPAAEAYRGLRTALQFAGLDRDLRIIQVTSSSPGEGKTTTVSNLAVALARAGQRVILLDADLRRPRLHRFFGLDNEAGLSTTIAGVSTLGQATQAIEGVDGLLVVTSGPPHPEPSELLSSVGTFELLELLRESADYVLIDCPPVLPVADSSILAPHADAVVLVATVDSTTKRNVARTIEVLHQVDAPLAGVVLNGLAGHGGYTYRDTAPADDRGRRGRRLPQRS